MSLETAIATLLAFTGAHDMGAARNIRLVDDALPAIIAGDAADPSSRDLTAMGTAFSATGIPSATATTRPTLAPDVPSAVATLQIRYGLPILELTKRGTLLELDAESKLIHAALDVVSKPENLQAVRARGLKPEKIGEVRSALKKLDLRIAELRKLP